MRNWARKMTTIDFLNRGAFDPFKAQPLFDLGAF
jgi:hypothetical protein